MAKVGVPTVSGVKSSLGSYAVGAGGGLFYGIVANMFGNGLIGGLAGAGLAGSVVKGTKGEILATMLGFQAGMSLIGGGNDNAEASSSGGVI